MQASAFVYYTGAGQTTDSAITLVFGGTSTKTIYNTGTGPLIFTTPWSAIQGGWTANRVPIQADSDIILQGFNIPGRVQYVEKRGAGTLSVSGPSEVWDYVHLYAGTFEVNSEINDGAVYRGAIETGPGNGGKEFIAVPAGTPMEVGMGISHQRIDPGLTIVDVVDPGADPVICELSEPIGDNANRTETGSVGFTGSLGMCLPTSDKLRWVNSATLAYKGPDDSTNKAFTVDNGDIGTWEVIGGTTLEVTGESAATTGGIAKTGPGTLALSGTLQHTGNNTVTDGTLQINGDASAMTGTTTVDGTGTLGGTGTIGGNVKVLSTGSLSPGASAGTLTILGNLDLFADGAGLLNFELDSLAGPNDLIDVSGTLIIGVDELGFTDFNFTDLGGLQNGTYTLISSGGLNPGDTLDPADLSGSIGAGAGTLQITGGDVELVVSGLGAASPYDAWAGTNAPGQTPEDDFDLDGVENGVEFVLGGDKDTNDLDKLPGVEVSGGNLLFSFERDQTSIDPSVTVTIEVGTDLASWPSTFNVGADTGSSDAGVTVTKDSPVAGTDTVSLSVAQAPDDKKFARLKVEIAP